ncbi:MAG TPA: hypothetical protein VIW95_00670 [Candidatus Binatus sp.]|uniref:hypothetical protein n=1 Tax=Candidatus Binatus sp. TaxID=2811406 RepID=UPI002F3EDAD5
MTLRSSTAALALVSWYLIVPPSLLKAPKDKMMASLSHWTIVREFDVEKDCDSERAKSSKGDSNLGQYRGMPPEEIYDAQCVATDDPRLKSN